MRKIVITRGIPGSGKSTWAKKWVKEDPEHRIRFNRDDMRNMMGPYWVPAREVFLTSIYFSFLEDAMLCNYDIVIDNMNLNKETIREIENIVKEHNTWIKQSNIETTYEIAFKDFFDVPLETCIERDSERENPVGEKAIRDIYNKYKDSYPLENNKKWL